MDDAGPSESDRPRTLSMKAAAKRVLAMRALSSNRERRLSALRGIGITAHEDHKLEGLKSMTLEQRDKIGIWDREKQKVGGILFKKPLSKGLKDSAKDRSGKLLPSFHLSKWEERYFEIDTHQPYSLQYYPHKDLYRTQMGEPAAILPLSGASVANLKETDSTISGDVTYFIFEVHFHGKDEPLVLATVKANLRDKWVAAIGYVIDLATGSAEEPKAGDAEEPTSDWLQKSGFMKKGGHTFINTGMKSRFFELSRSTEGPGYTLAYYSGQDKEDLKGEIDMRDAKVTLNGLRFNLDESPEYGEGKKYVMVCSSPADAQEWVAVLTQAAKRTQWGEISGPL